MFSRLTSALLLFATCATTANAALSFTGANWIWGVHGNAPPPLLGIEQVGFRKDFPTPPCNPPTSVEVIITADDAYTLYVNGVNAGSAENWGTPKFFCVLTNPLDIQTIFMNRIVIAVLGANTLAATPAGLIATVKINYFGGGSAQFVTDDSWVTFTSSSSVSVPSGFQAPNFDDSTWVAAVEEELYGGSTWGSVPAPTNQTCSLCSSSTTILTVDK